MLLLTLPLRAIALSFPSTPNRMHPAGGMSLVLLSLFAYCAFIYTLFYPPFPIIIRVVFVRVVYRTLVLTIRPRLDSNASNFTYQPTFQEGYGGSASSFTHQPTYQEDYGGSASNYTHQPTYQEGYGSSASNYIHEPTHRERYGSSASNYIPTHREGYGSSASNYIHEPTHQEGYGSYATDHGIPATNPRHQSSRTGRSEPQELDSNQGYETTPGQSQYRQRRNRNPISPAFDEDIRSSISTPPRGGSRSTDHPLAPPVPQPSVSICLF